MINQLIRLIAVISFSTSICKASSSCDRSVQVSYLNGAIYMVAKKEFDFAGKPRDCSDILQMGHIKSGKYSVWPTSRLLGNKSLEVYCDMKTEDGGWTVIQRRDDLGNPTDYFDKDWNSYKFGFGDLKKEFWLGNDYISALTNQRLYSVRFNLKDADDETKVAQYDTFWIDDQSNKYMLHVAGYKGTAGDSLKYHNNEKFSTKDQDNDKSDGSCANYFSGGWWYNDCHVSNLNGEYIVGKGKKGYGLSWVTWKGHSEFLASSAIMIRPKNFKLR